MKKSAAQTARTLAHIERTRKKPVREGLVPLFTRAELRDLPPEAANTRVSHNDREQLRRDIINAITKKETAE